MTLSLREAAIPASPLARWDARWKLAALGLLGLASACLRQPTSAALAAMLALGLARLGRVPSRLLLSRLSLVGLAVLPAVIVLPATLSGPGGEWAIGSARFSEHGFRTAIMIALRAVAMALLAITLLQTTPFVELLHAAQALRAPGLLVQILQLAYRYAFLFFEEVRRLRIALRTRGHRTRLGVRTYRTLGQAAGSLLVHGSDRAERVSEAMRCRGFRGRYRGLAEFHSRGSDRLGFLLAMVAALALLLLDWL